jgi:ankyrin repeat protein
MRAYLELEHALRGGDLDAARRALDDPAGFPDVREPYTGRWVFPLALAWSPAATIRELLELGAHPNFEANDGFPALVEVTLSEREDRHAVLELLLAAGADVGRRGLNDWTPLHAAASRDDAVAIGLLLRAHADPSARTGIDDHETPLELAVRAGNAQAATALEGGEPWTT